MSNLKYNPYSLTDAELFGSVPQSIAIQAIISTWEARAGLPQVSTLRATTVSAPRTGFGRFGFGGGVSGPVGPNAAAIAAARQRSTQLPNIILADVSPLVQAMTSIEVSLKKKYSEPQIIGMTPVTRAGFGFSIPSRPIIGPPGGVVAERKAIVTNKESEGNVIFKFNGQTYLYWARQHRLMQMATESMKSSLAGVGINLSI
jgi:hypothetical protein